MAILNYIIDPKQKLLVHDKEALIKFEESFDQSQFGTRLPKTLTTPKNLMLEKSKGVDSVVIGNSQTYILGFDKSFTPEGYSHETLLNLSLPDLGQNEMLYFLKRSSELNFKKAFIIIPHNLYQKLHYNRWPISIQKRMRELAEVSNISVIPLDQEESLQPLLSYVFSFKTFWESYDHINSWKDMSLQRNYVRQLKEMPNLEGEFKSFVLKNGATAWSSKSYKNINNKRAEESSKILIDLKTDLEKYQLLRKEVREKAISSLHKVFVEAKNRGISVTLFISPVFINFQEFEENENFKRFFNDYQNEVIDLANKLHIKVYGGYDFCPDDMFDFLHPRFDCVKKAIKHSLN
ncbi:MAG: hypothetical protein NXH75_12170 [Halobacteriovoraceae bacterium]|nr:hypothetical protein [Halobacteriovoraceae bacterium]